MSSSIAVEQHVLYRLLNAQIREWPYPHFFVPDVFPCDFYSQIQQFLRQTDTFQPSETFANRSFAKNGLIPGTEFMETKDFLRNMLGIFQNQLQNRFGGKKVQLYKELRLVRDQQNYKIGPHTDARWKVLSLLFYLPQTLEYKELGTSIFVPKDSTFTCEGGPHYPFEPFEKVYTAPYIPNSCFGFWKTNQSFHGVEPVSVEVQRDVLLYNIYEREAFDARPVKDG